MDSSIYPGFRQASNTLPGLVGLSAATPRAAAGCGGSLGVVGASRPPREGKVERSARKPGNQRVFSRSASRGHWLCGPWVDASQSR